MGPEETFEKVLDQVYKSNLNFKMSRTPYSAVITMKKSFKKIFGDSQGEVIEVKTEKDETKKIVVPLRDFDRFSS